MAYWEETNADPMREIICFAAGRLVELEVGGMTGAAHGENSAERLARPNAYAWPRSMPKAAFGAR